MSKHLKHAAILTVIVSVLLIIMPAAANSACAPQFDVMLNLCSCSNIDPSMYFNTNKAGCTLAACESHFGDCTSNAAPTATGVSITGTAAVGQILTGTYTYADAENDAEGTSTLKWYIAIDSGKLAVGTGLTYTPTVADIGSFLYFEVTPVATGGTTPGKAVMSAGVKVTGLAPGYSSTPAPGSTIINVGSASVGASVSKPLSVSETGTAELKVTKIEITGINAADFSVTPATLTIADGGAAQDLTIKCTPSAMGVYAAMLKVNHNAAGTPATYMLNCMGLPNAAPTATPSITGSDCLTQELTGSYVYKDTDTPADAEDTAAVKFQWYTGTDASCSGKAAISGATSKTYTPTDADKGKFICFGVTPAALTGTKQGTEAIATTKAAVDTPVYASVPDKGTSISFETLKGKSADKTLTVTNAGTGTLSVSLAFPIETISGFASGWFEVTPTKADIACPGNKPFTITCKGKEKGTVTGTLTVTHNAADAVCSGCPSGDTTATYPLSCVVTAAPVYSSSTAPNGTLSMTSCTPADAATTLTVTNTGSDVLQITNIKISGANKDKFSFTAPTSGENEILIAVGKSLVVKITGKGSTVGNFTGTLELTHNAAGSPAAYKLSSVISDCYVPVYYEPSYYAPPVNQAPVADILYVSTVMNKAISVALTGIDPGSDFFTLLMKPLTYSVVTQPQHGALTGTAPNLIYTPEQGFTGTDSFTYRIYDGTAYSAPAAVSVIVHQNSHANIGDKYEIDIFCAEYEGAKYGFRLNLTPVAADPSAYYWKGDIPTFGKAYSDSNTKGCISVEKGFQLNIPSALFQGTLYQFTLNFTPVAADPFGFYWKMDLGTLKTH